ncbi:MAG: AAA domain-containing protein, partial [Bacteroidota bacterium]
RHADRVTRNWRPAAMKLEGNMAGFSLNSPQWTAVDEALTRRLSVIWGPPGTGKSRTLRHLILVAILEAYEAGRPLRLLVTAGTYTAIDNVLLDLFDDLQGITPIIPSSAYEVKRLRSKSRPTEDAVLNRGLDLPVNKHNLDPALGTLHQRLVHREGITVVGVTPDQVHNFLVATGSAQQELFDLVVLDEASQVDTAHAILPLCAIDGEGSLVVAGDDLQLAPIRKAEPPKGLEKLVGSAYGFFAGHHGVPEAPLEVNYRSNRTLVEFGVKAGYNKTLRPHSPDLRLSLLSPLPTGAVPPVGWPQHLLWSPEWSALLDPDHPAVCFVHDDERSSQSNAFEADAVAALLWLLRERLPVTDSRFGLENDLGPNGIPKPVSTATYGDRDSSGRASGGFWGRGVGVVTPHRAQVGRILSTVGRTFPVTDRELLRGAVDTVERFQGQQRDVIIGSFALGDPDAIVNEDEFLYSLSRFNVMASRARAKLILLVSQTVVDHLSNDLETLRGSRLLKLYADVFCSSERKMTLGYLQLLTIGRPPQLVTRSGLFKWH